MSVVQTLVWHKNCIIFLFFGQIESQSIVNFLCTRMKEGLWHGVLVLLLCLSGQKMVTTRQRPLLKTFLATEWRLCGRSNLLIIQLPISHEKTRDFCSFRVTRFVVGTYLLKWKVIYLKFIKGFNRTLSIYE